MTEQVWSYYWNWKWSHTNGPQKCVCGGSHDCKDREKHISAYVKKEKNNEHLEDSPKKVLS